MNMLFERGTFTKIKLWSLLCRGRKKRIVALLVMFVILLFATLYLSYGLILSIQSRNSWITRLQEKHKTYIDKDGMRVVVGYYVGGSQGGQLSDDVIHSNNYLPVHGAGEGGRPVELSPRELIYAKELYSLHSYNIMVSDKIPINRSLPDVRSESCKNVIIPLDNLPSASVIIVFHNEAWSTLMRTVMSVILRSPPSLLKEIILVDDASERKYLGKELDDAVAELPVVRVLRSANRSGLVGARLMGASETTGDVLVFLDAHCEVTTGWMEPLLDRAGSDDVFICPHIDLLSSETLAYIKSVDAHWGAFSWRLHFRWLLPSKEIMMNKTEHPSNPYPTPAMAGGLFAVRRSLFWRLGGYDKGMVIWGGENLELSWRAWQCGARVEITPCSRVGHIFRRHSPYKYPGGVSHVLYSNLARAAIVWMDEWADFYFKFNPAVEALRDKQLVGDRIELRETLKCKSFDWYLRNVWPQHFFPTKDRWFGRIRNDKGSCLCVTPSKTPGLAGPATGERCGSDYDLDRLLVYTPEGRIMANEGLCLELANRRAIWKSCSDNDNQIWTQLGTQLKTADERCLTLAGANKNGEGDPIKVRECKEMVGQKWQFDRVPWK